MAKIEHRFSESFTLKLISRYLTALLVLVILEAGGRFGLLTYRFATEGEEQARYAAERLAADVHRIMINRGGPVAASTVYPILQRSFGQAGLDIAIVPSEATISSIEKQYGFTPEGLPADWPDGWYTEAAVELTAQEFCLGCHVDATRGGVLGAVTVRNYFSAKLETFWQETQVLGLVAMANVILATGVLFFLLRRRLGPLVAMDEVINELAKSGSAMTRRVDVGSRDEFGRLAHDTNRLLDRVGEVTEDLARHVDAFAGLLQRHRLARQELERHLDELQESFRRRRAGEPPDSSDAGEIRAKIIAAKACRAELRHLEESMQRAAEEARRVIHRIRRDDEA